MSISKIDIEWDDNYIIMHDKKQVNEIYNYA